MVINQDVLHISTDAYYYVKANKFLGISKGFMQPDRLLFPSVEILYFVSYMENTYYIWQG